MAILRYECCCVSVLMSSWPLRSIYSTAWSTKVLSACCQPVTKGHSWHIDYLSVILFCHGLGGMYLTPLCSKQSNYIQILLDKAVLQVKVVVVETNIQYHMYTTIVAIAMYIILAMCIIWWSVAEYWSQTKTHLECYTVIIVNQSGILEVRQVSCYV